MLEWHDCKTDPPKESGWYILIERSGDEVVWIKAYWNKNEQRWQDYFNIFLHEVYCYKWAKVELPE